MKTRSLNLTQERHLVLDYLLRRKMALLVAEYGITRQTIYRILRRHEVEMDRK